MTSSSTSSAAATAGGSGGDDVGNYVAGNLIEAAAEFRNDAKLSAKPFSNHFFCRICGSPAGNDMYLCYGRAHPICRPCGWELKPIRCPIPCILAGQEMICEAKICKFKSTFREIVFRETKVGCINRSRGCSFVGVWEKVKKHQDSCEFAKVDKPKEAEANEEDNAVPVDLCKLNI